MVDSLFLHMGPGLNAHCERVLLAEAWPRTFFWDQPPVRGENAFTALVQAAGDEVRRLSDARKGPIRVVAHSFGGNILRPLLREMPDRIDRADLYGCGVDVAGGFRRLLTRLGGDAETPPALREKIAEFARRRPADDLWPTIGLIVEDPAFMRLYWPNREDFLAHGKIAAGGPPIDFESFQSVLNEYSRNPESIPTRIPWKGDAKLVLGEDDPLIEAEELAAIWRIALPGIAVETVANSGHYTHLEPTLRQMRK